MKRQRLTVDKYRAISTVNDRETNFVGILERNPHPVDLRLRNRLPRNIFDRRRWGHCQRASCLVNSATRSASLRDSGDLITRLKSLIRDCVQKRHWRDGLQRKKRLKMTMERIGEWKLMISL